MSCLLWCVVLMHLTILGALEFAHRADVTNWPWHLSRVEAERRWNLRLIVAFFSSGVSIYAPHATSCHNTSSLSKRSSLQTKPLTINVRGFVFANPSLFDLCCLAYRLISVLCTCNSAHSHRKPVWDLPIKIAPWRARGMIKRRSNWLPSCYLAMTTKKNPTQGSREVRFCWPIRSISENLVQI